MHKNALKPFMQSFSNTSSLLSDKEASLLTSWSSRDNNFDSSSRILSFNTTISLELSTVALARWPPPEEEELCLASASTASAAAFLSFSFSSTIWTKVVFLSRSDSSSRSLSRINWDSFWTVALDSSSVSACESQFYIFIFMCISGKYGAILQADK